MTGKKKVVGGTVLNVGKTIEVLGSDGVWYRVQKEKQFKDFKWKLSDVVWIIYEKVNCGEVFVLSFVEYKEAREEEILAMVAL
jgi:hypothetical protein